MEALEATMAQSNLAQVLKLVEKLSPEELCELRIELDSREPALTWSNVNLDNDSERDAFMKEETAKAGKRIKHAVKKLQELQILDKNGNLVEAELPADMMPGSQCDVGG
jgi:hypothetical protein